MKKITLVFLLVFISSIKLHAQLSPNIILGINPTRGIQYNTNLVIENGFKLNKELSNNDKLYYIKQSNRIDIPEMITFERVIISKTETIYETEVELDEIENYINKLNFRYVPKNYKISVHKISGNNTMYTYLIKDNLLLTLSGYSSDNAKGKVYYVISKF